MLLCEKSGKLLCNSPHLYFCGKLETQAGFRPGPGQTCGLCRLHRISLRSTKYAAWAWAGHYMRSTYGVQGKMWCLLYKDSKLGISACEQGQGCTRHCFFWSYPQALGICMVIGWWSFFPSCRNAWQSACSLVQKFRRVLSLMESWSQTDPALYELTV